MKPGMAERYRAAHDAIWPELAKLLRNAGVHAYSIFLDETTMSLFAIMHVHTENSLDRLHTHPTMRRWWDHMAPIMEVEPGNRPREWPLTQVFHLA